jgi:hypothetical protein
VFWFLIYFCFALLISSVSLRTARVPASLLFLVRLPSTAGVRALRVWVLWLVVVGLHLCAFCRSFPPLLFTLLLLLLLLFLMPHRRHVCSTP